jgi:hypothetical protein
MLQTTQALIRFGGSEASSRIRASPGQPTGPQDVSNENRHGGDQKAAYAKGFRRNVPARSGEKAVGQIGGANACRFSTDQAAKAGNGALARPPVTRDR